MDEQWAVADAYHTYPSEGLHMHLSIPAGSRPSLTVWACSGKRQYLSTMSAPQYSAHFSLLEDAPTDCAISHFN
jgi:hypothetical protein